MLQNLGPLSLGGRERFHKKTYLGYSVFFKLFVGTQLVYFVILIIMCDVKSEITARPTCSKCVYIWNPHSLYWYILELCECVLSWETFRLSLRNPTLIAIWQFAILEQALFWDPLFQKLINIFWAELAKSDLMKRNLLPFRRKWDYGRRKGRDDNPVLLWF